MLLREATSETYGPRVSFSSYQSPLVYYCFAFTLLLLFTLHLYTKNTKKYYLSSLSDLTLSSGREGIDNPFIALGASCLIVCASIR